jgi:multicomponent Na+:H+ antiporter subunit B
MESDLTQYLDYALILMMFAVGIAVVRMRNLFAAVMLTGVYSLLSAAWFASLDAVDVAFTEAAVGAGISTVLMLGAMLLTAREAEPTTPGRHWAALAVVVAAGAALLFAVTDMPIYGDAHSIPNAYVGLEYLQQTPNDIAVPNVVTAVLASYRGFDTMGETTVIFAAAVAVMLLLGFGKASKNNNDPEDEA